MTSFHTFSTVIPGGFNRVVAQVSKPAVSPIYNRQRVQRLGAGGFGNPRYSRLGSLRYCDCGANHAV
jgi:hypothetical protein